MEQPRRMLRQAKTGRGRTGSRWRGDGCVLNGEPTCGGSGGIDELEERTEQSDGEKKLLFADRLRGYLVHRVRSRFALCDARWV